MGLTRADGAGHFDPLLYPWDPPVASGVIDGNDFRPLELSAGLDEALAQASAAPLEARSLVVSIGSNSSADVMRRKFASYHQPASAVLPLVRGQLHNIAVGHPAHVSKAGYIAAAPYPLMGECTAVWLSWLDDVQLMALDETEPNYRRIQLDGGKLPFLDQPALFGLLAGGGTGDLLEQGKSVFDGPPERVAEQLATPSVQDWARDWSSSAVLAAQWTSTVLARVSRPCGTSPSPGGGVPGDVLCVLAHRRPSCMLMPTSSCDLLSASRKAGNLNNEGMLCLAFIDEPVRFRQYCSLASRVWPAFK